MRVKRSNKTRKVRRGGSKSNNSSIIIPVHKILLTDPIVTAATSMNPEVSTKGFKKMPGHQGFKLTRVNSIARSKMNELPNISVTPYKTTSYYSIVDGRHRFAKALAEGRNSIRAKVIEH